MASNTNFPVNLNIKPSHNSHDRHVLNAFDSSAQEAAIREYGIAGRVWEAAFFLNTYIEGLLDITFDPPFSTPHDEEKLLSILELGSGTGIVSAKCAKQLSNRQCTVIATDLPEVCPLLAKNLCKYSEPEHASGPRLLVRPLAWGNYEQAEAILHELKNTSDQIPANSGPNALTHIICSDLIYFSELLAPLLRSLLHLTGPPFVSSSSTSDWPKIIISYKVRSLPTEMPFWSAFGLWFTFEPVLCRQSPPHRPNTSATGNDPEARAGEALENFEEPEEDTWRRFGSAGDDEVFVLVARRRPESLVWDVPPDDVELLGGVGASGTPSRKGDCTFETLLLMGMEGE
ncbi:uncharacterized protein PHACADRAFT_182832 [Phanerochaete carnosa HHB-10118-sp]|uniref:Methyltransferase domain-containing protein n=1 Tax=Phanerochaete carnosa (strain HHB-10118-sp) TaxID=650164 RepID=K5WHD2_PHACS|nr:uncharacterized protein PHACADRAFT_182832 [Phanerochaete carnosa HHB-10118-sp]EKM58519.1 hypothetical protein PHACADRAFT_182832 [Phanerochaete carnosa HHB-10118-sp]